MAQQTARSRAPANQEGMKSPGCWNREAPVRRRDYTPTHGRFIERDPIGFEAGDTNWYRFVANGPTGNTDPSGLTTVNYIPGRLNLIDATITKTMQHVLGSEFDVGWSVNNAAFVDQNNCKLCDEIGILQIVTGTGGQGGLGLWAPGTHAELNYSWRIDTLDPDPAYGQASSKFGGVARGDPTVIRVLSAEDVPGLDPSRPAPYVQDVVSYSMKAQTYAVCLKGIEGIRSSESRLPGYHFKDTTITVYAGVTWEHEFVIGKNGAWSTGRAITSTNAVPSPEFKRAVETWFGDGVFYF